MPDRDTRRMQIIGTEMDLNESGPCNMIADDFAGGMEQIIGTMSNISRKTDPMGSFEGMYSKHISGGKVEMIGQTEPTLIDRKARRGWDSYETPISNNSEEPTARKSSYPGRSSR